MLMGALTACSTVGDWMGTSEEETPLKGDRETLLAARSAIAPDAELSNMRIDLPEPEENGVWYQDLAFSINTRYPVRHLKLDGNLHEIAKVREGSASDTGYRLASTPLVLGEFLYVLDGKGVVYAHDAEDVTKIRWQTNLHDRRERYQFYGIPLGKRDVEFLGGQMTYAGLKLFVTTGHGDIYALNAENGEVLWRRSIQVPIKSAPAARADMLLFVTAENTLYALSSETGDLLWTHNGIKETTSLLGAAAPVALNDGVVVPYSSGELYYLKRMNGAPSWGKRLGGAYRSTTQSYAFSDIDANPVVYNGRIFASTEEGYVVALDLFTGQEYWRLPATLSSTPWLAGEWLFGVTDDAELVAIHAPSGKVKWTKALEQYQDKENSKGRILWHGPVLASGNLILTSTRGDVLFVDAQNGETKQTLQVSEGIYLPPVVAHDKLYLWHNDATLTVLAAQK